MLVAVEWLLRVVLAADTVVEDPCSEPVAPDPEPVVGADAAPEAEVDTLVPGA